MRYRVHSEQRNVDYLELFERFGNSSVVVFLSQKETELVEAKRIDEEGLAQTLLQLLHSSLTMATSLPIIIMFVQSI